MRSHAALVTAPAGADLYSARMVMQLAVTTPVGDDLRGRAELNGVAATGHCGYTNPP